MAVREFVKRAAATRFTSAVIWTVYLMIPVRASGLFHGVPLGPLDAATLLAIWWLALGARLSNASRAPSSRASRGRTCISWPFSAGGAGLLGACSHFSDTLLVDRRIGGSRLIGAAALVMLIVSFAAPAEHGFRARYYADAGASGPIEPSTEFRRTDFTRIDQRLDFVRGGPELPLVFFNDIARFNFYTAGQPDRDKLPFAVVWDGNWSVDTDGTPRTLYLDAPRASAELFVDAAHVVAVTSTDRMRTAVVAPAAGWHQIYIRFSSPYGAPRAFSAGELIDNTRVPFDGTSVRTRRIERWQLGVARLFDRVKTIVDACALGWLALLVVAALWDLRSAILIGGSAAARRRSALAVFALVAIVEACLFAAAWAGRLFLLSGGDDPMTYEFYARHIQLDGPLMRFLEGPYYTQVFYPYFLAATHAVFGEGMFGIMLVQRLLIAVVVWMVVDIAVRIGGDDVWLAAFGCGGLIAYSKLPVVSTSLLNEALFVPLLVTWTAAVIRVCQDPTAMRVAGTGLLGGITALTRSTALLACAAVFPAFWTAWKPVARRGVFLTTFAVSAGVVVSLIAVRNWIVIHEFVPVPAELPVTLLDGNRPPPDVPLDLTRRAPLYDRIGIGLMERQVIEYALTAPVAFARNIGRKFLFALGFYEVYAPGWGYSVAYIVLWVASVAGFMLAVRARAAPVSAIAVPALIALTQFAALVLVYPKGERLLLPFYTVLVAYAAIAVDRVCRAGARNVAQGFSPATAGLKACATGDSSRDRIGAGVLVAALCVYTFVIRTRGISEHFLMLGDQIRDWSIALRPFSALPLVGPPSNAGGNSLGPVFYWVLWLIRVVIGPMVDNLPHAGGIGLSVLQSCADGVLCAGIRRASGSWVFAIAAVLVIASSPFDLALSSVIWNPVLAVAFAKTATGLVLYWGETLTRPRRITLCALAWLSVQAHSATLPFAVAIFFWVFWTQLRRGRITSALAEAAAIVLILQLPSAFARESIQPTRLWALILHPHQRPVDAFRALCAAVASIAGAPFELSHVPLMLLGAAAALLVAVRPFGFIAAVTIVPLAMAVFLWSVWQGDSYESYLFVTLVPSAILTVMWTSRLFSNDAARSAAAVVLLAIAVLIQKPRIDNAMLVFRQSSYGALVRGSRAVVARGEPVRRIEAPFLPVLSNPEFVYRILGGQLRADSPIIARLSEQGEVTYIR